MNRPFHCYVVLAVATSGLLLMASLRHPVVSAAMAQEGIVWRDTERTAKGTSTPTKDNNNVWYGSNCEAKSDDAEGKWCASIVTVVVEIDPSDTENLYRLKFFKPTIENCRKAVRVESGPRDWNSTVDCKFSPSLRRFELREKGWTSPQTFTSEITIQERVR
jgi:hypothetical protein